VGNDERAVSVVFSGGGCKTFWSLGLLERLRPVLPVVREWAGVSAGAAMAAAAAAGRAQETVDDFCARTAANRANVYPLHVLSGQPVFPHEAMYRATILAALSGGGFEALQAAAPVRLLLAYLAEGASPLRTIVGAARAYRARKSRCVVHGPPDAFPGFRLQVVTAQDCASAHEVCDAVLASSCTPPLTSIQVRDGRRYADGALVDHAPVRALSPSARRGKVLVLTTMTIPDHAVPRVDGRLYLAPGRDLPIAMWDYASPAKVQATYDRGWADGARLASAVDAFLGA
jgi:predicted acylesterase/phospholipase RssA